MRIIDPGLLTTVQDLGRPGYQKVGVTPGGAMDAVALRIANLLVGNDDKAAALELTLRGATVEFEEDALVAVCGADLAPAVAGVRVPDWRTIFVARGAVLCFAKATWGCRAYLAIGGGIDVPEVMGSRSTYLRARIGGVDGRAVRAGDSLPIAAPRHRAARAISDAEVHLGPLPFVLLDARVDRDALGVYEMHRPMRFVRGPQFDLLDEQDRGAFSTHPFHVSPSSDRMGYRLDGALLASARGEDLVSTAVVTGTVQLPPGGQPIVLMADRQTTGGYPMIAHVITADLPRLAQLKPGDEISFEEVTLESAQAALRKRDEQLNAMRRELEADAQDRS